MNERAHCLFITTSFPPFPESQTIRNVFFVNGLLAAGFSITVVTGAASADGDRLLRNLLHPGVAIARTGHTPYHQLQAWITRLPMGAFLRRRLRSLTAVLAGKCLAPDAWAGWQRQAERLVFDQVRRGVTPSVVVSSSGSFTAHIAAARLARCFGVPWIAEYGDPWFLNPLGGKPRWARMLDRFWERRALENCSGMTVTTKETELLYRDWLREKTPRIEIVPCGFHRVAGGQSTRSTSGYRLRVAYVGSASATNRDLGLFMRMLEEALADANMRSAPALLRIVGSSSPRFESAAKGYSSFHTEFSGWVTYERSIEEMAEADVLLLFGNKSSSQIPGKAYQYMASGRPIVFVSQLPREDPTEALLRGHGGVLFLKVHATDNVLRLRRFLQALPRHEEAARRSAAHPEFISTYSWEALGRRFAAFVSSHLARN